MSKHSKNYIMKLILLTLFSIFYFSSYSQIVNGSFENASGSDLSGWEWTCGANSYNSGAPGGGDWSFQVMGGNVQGCFPGYAYQKIPGITNGLFYTLTAWVRAEATTPIGIYFGKINNGVVTFGAGDTTSANIWTYLAFPSNFSLMQGDTAVVILFGGLTTGPILSLGSFDLITLDVISNISDYEQKNLINMFPNPANANISIKNNSEEVLNCNIYDVNGQNVFSFELGAPQLQIDISSLSSGLYFLQAKGKHKVFHSKLMVCH